MMLTGNNIVSTYVDSYGLDFSRELLTCEIQAANDFYGNATALKLYAGLPKNYSLKLGLEHGSVIEDLVWEPGISRFKVVATPASPRAAYLAEKCGKIAVPLGPYIFYAPNALNEDDLLREKQRLGKSLLVFPHHSTHHVHCIFDVDSFIRRVKSFTHGFDSVRVCVYWADIKKKWVSSFVAEGWEIVTAGHMFDASFLSRLKNIISLADVAIGNIGVGTCSLYSNFLGVPYCGLRGLDDFDFKFSPVGAKDIKDQSKATSDNNRKLLASIPEIYDFSFSISANERVLFNEVSGAACIHSQSELRAILEIAEDIFRLSAREKKIDSPAKVVNCLVDYYSQSGDYYKLYVLKKFFIYSNSDQCAASNKDVDYEPRTNWSFN